MSERLEAAISRCGEAVERRMFALLPDEAPKILHESLQYHLATGGKRLRPALCILTCEAFGGAMERALDFAAAVELLHNMFLVHDDVEDGDEVRRDQPTLWVKYGVAHAINAGDYLLGVACRAVLRTPGGAELRCRLMDAFNFACLRTVEGQAMDIGSRADPAWTIERYRTMVELKTGCYLALGMVGAAIIAGADDAALDRLWAFGKCAGPAFQVRDNVLDLTPGKGRGGQIGSDIKEGKASILYAHALQAAGPGDRAQLIAVMARPREATTDDDVQWVMDLYERCGSVAFGRDFSEELLARAQAHITALPLVESELLTQLTTYMIERRS